MKRTELFQHALEECLRHLAAHPDFRPLKSIENQLRYLLDLVEGRRQDRDLLATINLGLLAAREIETMDMQFANLLYDVDEQVDLLKSES